MKRVLTIAGRIASGPTTVTVKAPCIVTGKPYSVTAPYAGWKAWRAGELIQNALPELSKDDREFLTSGTSPAGWDLLFPEERNEEGPTDAPACPNCGEPVRFLPNGDRADIRCPGCGWGTTADREAWMDDVR